jgi:DNA adenine methylase
MRSQMVESENDLDLRLQLPNCYPFVKWAGGKSQLLRKLGDYIPSKFNNYFEPFLGGGAMFFYLACQRTNKSDTFLSDTNRDLINAYNVIKVSVEELIQNLKIHQRKYNASPYEYYYELRARVKPISDIESAGRFIALNKTCYNGLYRVNKSGMFNVPMGKYKNPLICDAQNLRNISTLLRQSKTKFLITDYKKILIDHAGQDDFIYIDPPYSPVTSTANFTSYTDKGFNTQDQKELADIFKLLDERDCRLLLSNSDSQLIRQLYEEYSKYTVEVDVNRSINSKSSRRSGHKELLIRNYK